jgi:hypothetical protein
VAATKAVPALCRFVGARLDDEIVLLDRTTNSLIHLNRNAARVWEACASLDSADGAASSGDTTATEDLSVRETLAAAGVLRRVHGRHVPAGIEWA